MSYNYRSSGYTVYGSNIPYDDNYYEYESSDDELVTGFNRLSVKDKKAIIDCKECFTCEHLTVCTSYHCGTCEQAIKIGCQNKFCKRHNCRESSSKCTCTTEKLLLEFANTRHLRKGAKEVFGWFSCSEKKGKKTVICKRWNSAHAWIEMGKLLTQQCQKCEKPCKPVKVKRKEWRGQQEASGEKPHDEVKFLKNIKF